MSQVTNTFAQDMSLPPIDVQRKWLRILFIPFIGVFALFILFIAFSVAAICEWCIWMRDIYNGQDSGQSMLK